jgi:hypothetical protein
MAHGGPPRWHGNGFTQLDLNARQRLHVWHPEWDPNANHNSTIHDHVFDLTSEVLLGKVGHEVFEVEHVGGSAWKMYRLEGWPGRPYGGAAPAEDRTFLGYVVRRSVGSYLIPLGGQYTFPRYRFHESSHEGLTATLMTRSNGVALEARPRILCPTCEDPTDAREPGQGPSEGQMWRAIEQAVDKMWACSQQRIEACIS